MDVTQALLLLKEKGYKHTGKREQMLQLFSDQKRYIAAKDVLEAMQGDYPGLSFDTIYRNLSTFVDLGILEMTELDGEKKFRFSCSVGEHHHHIICLTCGKTKHIHLCPMDQLGDSADFKIVGHKFEIYGYCSECINE
ncbi:Fur family transcriptional regulator [Anaerobacillus isosaccharinicus]|uniref:Transcriptional repressor n=1 Tax=Anaerobacillus isosaccharinicus TaxID=1532552 RepID=A0A1S2LRE6_9BACI|nr:Fur family transcriptional regulator [Anaerobacillus isosaccharinicus]MBA5585529.1 transcriptional repressor [Anaerobacillus isosaccharinicus]QOY36157.1 transcriptional repressor [Anaerobacillus isosaccharinicus]